MAMTFGERLRRLREKEELSLEALAEKTGLSKAYLWKLEKKPDANPTLQVARDLAEGLDVSLRELIGDDTPASEATPEPGALPPGLQECWDKYKGQMTRADLEGLAEVHFRGSHPTDADGWFALYLQLKPLRDQGDG